jgi:hypothetical protein
MVSHKITSINSNNHRKNLVILKKRVKKGRYWIIKNKLLSAETSPVLLISDCLRSRFRMVPYQGISRLGDISRHGLGEPRARKRNPENNRKQLPHIPFKQFSRYSEEKQHPKKPENTSKQQKNPEKQPQTDTPLKTLDPTPLYSRPENR